MQRLDTQTIKPGFQFKNNSMRLTVVHFYGTDKRNLALLVRENDACPYITVRDLSETENGGYHRAGGPYFFDFVGALQGFRGRPSQLPCRHTQVLI